MSALYFVEEDHGPRIGKAFAELDRETNSLDFVIGCIVSGDIEKPIRVLEVIEDEGTVRDVTEDVARSVWERLADRREGCPDRLRNFIDNNMLAGDADRVPGAKEFA